MDPEQGGVASSEQACGFGPFRDKCVSFRIQFRLTSSNILITYHHNHGNESPAAGS